MFSCCSILMTCLVFAMHMKISKYIPYLYMLQYSHYLFGASHAGVCASIQHPVTKEVLFHTINHARWQPPAQEHHSGQSDRQLMPPPPKKAR